MRWKRLAVFALSMLAASATVSHAQDDPRLEKILDHWKKLPEDLKSCRISGRRFVYDNVFYTERRSEFQIIWNRDGRIIFWIKGVSIPAGTVSKKISPQGKPYDVKSGESELWYWPDFQRVVRILLEEEEGVEFETEPVFDNSREHIEFPIHPALSELTPKYKWRITDETEQSFVLDGKRNYRNNEFSPFASLKYGESNDGQTVELIVRKSDYSIEAVRMGDVTGTTESVYVFSERQASQLFDPNNGFIFNSSEDEKLKRLMMYYDTPPEDRVREIVPLRAPKLEHTSGLWKLAVEVTTRILGPWLQ